MSTLVIYFSYSISFLSYTFMALVNIILGLGQTKLGDDNGYVYTEKSII